VGLGAIVPGLALAATAAMASGTGAALLATLALASHVAGMLTERWLFFAEAKHTVMLYYGAEAA
ncbi:MAG: DMSO reductase, partial [Ottowia sp.]|nr:DMSO reductase [Ottowia sp.]